MKDYRKLDLEELDINDYSVLLNVLRLNSHLFKLLEMSETDFNELLSKIERNLDKLEYNEHYKF